MTIFILVYGAQVVYLWKSRTNELVMLAIDLISFTIIPAT